MPQEIPMTTEEFREQQRCRQLLAEGLERGALTPLAAEAIAMLNAIDEAVTARIKERDKPRQGTTPAQFPTGALMCGSTGRPAGWGGRASA